MKHTLNNKTMLIISSLTNLNICITLNYEMRQSDKWNPYEIVFGQAFTMGRQDGHVHMWTNSISQTISWTSFWV